MSPDEELGVPATEAVAPSADAAADPVGEPTAKTAAEQSQIGASAPSEGSSPITNATTLRAIRARLLSLGGSRDDSVPSEPVSVPPEYAARIDSSHAPLGAWRLPGPLSRFDFGLRARAAIALGLGALVISVAVSLLTYFVARRSLVDERASVTQKLIFSDALEAQSALASDPGNIGDVISSQEGQLQTILVTRGGTYLSNPRLSIHQVPARLMAETRSAANKVSPLAYRYQLRTRAGVSEMVVGVPLQAVGAQFYGFSQLKEVEARLRDLARTLTVAAILTSAGAALLGRSISRRLLRPLADVAGAAGGISSGRLDTRLHLTGDADLDPLLRSFNEMASSLQGRIEREARFASDVSHELRTPLTALVTAARLLDGRRSELSERGQKTLDVLVTQAAHFERLVLDLLEMSRFDAGAATIHAELVNLPELLRQVVIINESAAEVFVGTLDPYDVGVDKRRVERMVANLLQNAANYGGGATGVTVTQFTETSSDALSLHAGLSVEPWASGIEADDESSRRGPLRTIQISVDDAGPGVPVEEREKIFERFARGQSHMRSTSGAKGTGLGLALVSAHAKLHGGSVWVESSDAGGARFVVEISEFEVEE